MILFGQQLLAERVEGEELAGKDTAINESFGYQHDLSNKLKVRNNHSTWSGGGREGEREKEERRKREEKEKQEWREHKKIIKIQTHSVSPKQCL